MAQAATAELNHHIINQQFDHRVEFNSHESSLTTSPDSIPKNLQTRSDELIRKTKLHDLQTKRKLCLVLDLDNTLIHSKKLRKLSQEEKDRLLNQSNSQDIIRWDLRTLASDQSLKKIECVTKLRPFVRKFLEEANSLFEMCIYTFGSREYAFNIAKILDPECEYFGSRIFARDNCKEKGQKGLDVVKVPESGVIIVDDTESVWAKHERNLIVVNRYTYFADKESSTRSLSEDGIDEFEMMGALSCLLQKLKKVHRLYFERDTCSDVRELLDTVRKEFVMPGMDATTTALPISAEEVGAACLDNKVLVRSDERKEPEKKSAVRASSELKSAKRKRSNEEEYEAEYSSETFDKKPKC